MKSMWFGKFVNGVMLIFFYGPTTGWCDGGMVVTPGVAKSGANAGNVEITATLCHAEIVSGTPSDVARVVKLPGNIKGVRFGLGSEYYGAVYAATLCIVGTPSGDQAAMDLQLTLVLTDSDLTGSPDSYAQMAHLKLHVTLVCEDKNANSDLYNGSFVNQSVSLSWNQATGKQCALTMQWSEQSNAERPWGQAPASVSGLLALAGNVGH